MDCHPCDLFQLFFSKDVVHVLCRNTNLYAAKKKAEGQKRKWSDMGTDEVYHFISLILYYSLVKTSTGRDMWRRGRLYRLPFPGSLMPGYRYEAIMAFFHMSDPTDDAANDLLQGQPGYDGLCRIKPPQDQILTTCRAYYHPRQNLSVDERIVATKAKIGMKQFIEDKPTKWGYKLCILADSSDSYTCDFSIYEGKAMMTPSPCDAMTPSGQGLSFDLVVNLLHVPYLGTRYAVFVDNFYTSLKLFLHLRNIGCGACGTIHETRIGFPHSKVNALTKTAVRGDKVWIRNGPLLFAKWRDKRDVMMCSTLHKHCMESGSFHPCKCL